MASNKKLIFDEVSAIVQTLTQKIENLQLRVSELCKSTGGCAHIKKAHEDLLPPKVEKQ